MEGTSALVYTYSSSDNCYIVGTRDSSLSAIRNDTATDRTATGLDSSWQGGALVIPATYNDGTHGEFPVKGICYCAFYGINDITTVTIEDGGVTTIGARAFQTPTSPVESTMTSVYLPNTLEFLGIFNFARRTALETINFENCTSLGFSSSTNTNGQGICLGCTSLESVTIPAQISYLGSQFCTDCTSLQSITVLATTPPTLNYSSSTSNLPFYNSSCPIYVPEESVNSYQTAQYWRDYYASRIQAIPTNYGEISISGADIDLIDLIGDIGVKIYVGDGDEGILVYSRNKPTPYTSALVFTLSQDGTYYIVGTGYTSISAILSDVDASGGTYGSGLDNTWTGGDLVIPSEYEGLPVMAIACKAFYGVNNITSVSIPPSIEIIGSIAFATSSQIGADTTMTSFVFEKDDYNDTAIYYIGKNVFQLRQGLTQIEIPNSVTEIGNYTFYNCTGLTSLTIPSSVTSIGYSFAYGCTGLTRVNIYSTYTSKRVTTNSGSYCWFWNCSSSCVVHIPSSVSNPTRTYGQYWGYYSSSGQLSYTADL